MLHNLDDRIKAFVQAKLFEGKHTPFIVLDIARIKRNYEEFTKNFPAIIPHYALKANPHPEIIKAIIELNGSFDAASFEEISAILALNGSPEKILFANPVKKQRDVERAIAAGVDFFTFDSVEELKKINAIAARFDKRARLLIRLWVPNYGSVVDLSSKFGADDAAVTEILHSAKNLQHIDILGVAFHVGSQCLNPANFSKAFDIAKAQMAKAVELGFEMKYLDVGGGVPVNYTLEISYQQEIVETLQSLCKSIPADIQLIAEPGRNISATACTLVTSIILRTEKRNKVFYYIDDSIYQTFSGKVFDFTDYQFFPLERDAVPGSEVVIAGATCDGHDIIKRDALLPPDLAEGDILYVPNVGAYTSASASHFNGFEPPEIFAIY